MDKNRIKENCALFSYSASNREYYDKLIIAAEFDTSNQPLYLQILFESRKKVAKKILNETNETEYKQLIQMYEYINNDIKKVLGI